MSLSNRGRWAQELGSSSALVEVLKDPYDASTNPNGYLSLGIAENTLMHNVFSAHLHANLQVPNHALTYGDGLTGGHRMKAAVSRFLTKHLKPVVPVEPAHVTITNGCSSAIEHLVWMLADPGDGFLLGQPYYGSFMLDISFRPGVSAVKVPFGRDMDPMSDAAVLEHEKAILRARDDGVTVRGLALCHPHNPLGRCYPRHVLVQYMRLCEKYDMHLLSDEIYALSTWTNTVDTAPPPVEFHSCLSLNTEGIMDPARLHVVWGTSKDFGANGIRIGCIVSQHNPALKTALKVTGPYSSPSSISEHVVANMLEDDEWHDRYIAQNRVLLAEHYELVAKWAKKHGIPYAPGGNAGFFLWVDLGKKYRDHHGGKEVGSVGDVVMKALMKHKVFLASGKAFGAQQDGWFRIAFSVNKDVLLEGLGRVTKAVEADDNDAPSSNLALRPKDEE